MIDRELILDVEQLLLRIQRSFSCRRQKRSHRQGGLDARSTRVRNSPFTCLPLAQTQVVIMMAIRENWSTTGSSAQTSSRATYELAVAAADASWRSALKRRLLLSSKRKPAFFEIFASGTDRFVVIHIHTLEDEGALLGLIKTKQTTAQRLAVLLADARQYLRTPSDPIGAPLRSRAPGPGTSHRGGDKFMRRIPPHFARDVAETDPRCHPHFKCLRRSSAAALVHGSIAGQYRFLT